MREEALEKLKAKFRIADKFHEALYTRRQENIALYYREHWTYWKNNQKLKRVPQDTEEARITVNLARKNINARVGAILGPRPVFEIIPTSEQESDIASAYLSQQAIYVWWDQLKVVGELRSARRIAEILGEAYLEVYYDWFKGRFIKNIEITPDNTGFPVLTKEGTHKAFIDNKGKATPLYYKVDSNKVPQDRIQREGEIALFPRFPDSVYVPIDAWDWSFNHRKKTDARWMFLKDFILLEDIEKNKNWKQPDEEITICDDLPVSTIQQVVFDLYDISFEEDVNKGEKWVECLRYYEFPNKEFPRGRYLVILPENGWHICQEIDELPPPYQDDSGAGIVPLVKFTSLKTDGMYNADSVLTDAGPLNQEYNFMRSLQIDNIKRNQMLILLDRSRGLTAKAISKSSRGLIIEYDGQGMGYKGSGIDVINPSTYSIAEKDQVLMLKSEIEDIMSYHEPQPHPAQRRTLGEAQMVQSFDAFKMESTVVSEAEEAYEDLARILLLFGKHYYDEERIFRVTGSNNRWKVMKFKGSQLGYHDIRIQKASSMPRSKYLQQQRILMLATQGYFRDMAPTTKLKVLQLLDMEEVHPMKEEQYDVTNAQNENFDMLNGKTAKVQKEDNNTIHIQEHRILLKSPEFRDLPKTKRDKTRAVVEQHIIEHFKMLMDKENQNMQMIQSIAQQPTQNLQETGQNQGVIQPPGMIGEVGA